MITIFTLLFLSIETIQELLCSISSIILLSTIHIFQNLCFVICFQVIFNHLTAPLTLIGETILQGLVFISLSHQFIISALLVCLASPIQSRTENEGWQKRNVTSSPTALMDKILSAHTKCGFPEVGQSLLLETDKIPGGAHFHNTIHVRFNQILYRLAICILVVQSVKCTHKLSKRHLCKT